LDAVVSRTFGAHVCCNKCVAVSCSMLRCSMLQ